MIVLKNVCKSYIMGDNVVNALQGVTLTIEQGEFVSLIGASAPGNPPCCTRSACSTVRTAVS